MRLGENSVPSAITDGSTPPTPMPEPTRSSRRDHVRSVAYIVKKTEHRQHETAHDDGALASETVAEDAEQHGAQHQTEIARAENEAHRRARDSPILDDGGRGKARRLRLKPIHEHGDEKKGAQHDLEGADTLALDHLIDVDDLRGGH